SRALRPVALGPFWRLVVGVAAELQDVPQREAYVLEQLPRRMRQPLGRLTAQLGGEILPRGAQVGMGFVPVDRLGKLLTQKFVVIHETSQKCNRYLWDVI